MSSGQEAKVKIKEAVTCLIKQKNIEDITVKEIVTLSGISRSTFYRLYAGVDQLIKALEHEMLETLRDLACYSIQAPLELKNLNQPDPIYMGLFEYLYRERAFYLAITSPNGDPPVPL